MAENERSEVPATSFGPVQVAERLLGWGVWRVEVKTHGDPTWYRNQTTYSNYFEALVWALVTLERWTAAEDVRVVRVDPEPISEVLPPQQGA